MTTIATASEETLGHLACQPFVSARQPKILIGGLGMGYTLAAVKEKLPQKRAQLHVAEILPDVVTWNRTHLKELHDGLLDDSRIKIVEKPVQEVIRSAEPSFYHAILLDVDNGPQAFHGKSNDALYTRKGILEAQDALQEGGLLAVWSAGPDAAFEKRLRSCGFDVTEKKAPTSHKGRKKRFHTIWIAKKGDYEKQPLPRQPI